MGQQSREIFPLPLLPSHSCQVNNSSMTRSVKQRVGRKTNLLSWANEGLGALNDLFGCSSQGLGPPSQKSSECAKKVVDAYLALGSPKEVEDPEAAFSALLSKCSVYADARADVAKYDFEKLSWPKNGSKPVIISDYLGEKDTHSLSNWRSCMLRDVEDFKATISRDGEVKPHCDPVLFSSCEKYGSFLKGLDEKGMLGWRVASNSEVHNLGIFFVYKKDKKSG